MTKYQKALQLFVNSDNRPDISVPFSWKQYAMATNGYALIRMPLDLSPEVAPYAGKIDFDKVWPGQIENLNLCCDIIEFKAAMDLMEQVDEKRCTNDDPCIHCGGEGQVEWTYESKTGRTFDKEDECPACDGEGIQGVWIRTGNIVPSEYDKMKIGTAYITGFMVMKIYKLAEILEATQINLLHQTEEHKPLIFSIGEAELLAMPAMVDSHKNNIAECIFNPAKP